MYNMANYNQPLSLMVNHDQLYSTMFFMLNYGQTWSSMVLHIHTLMPNYAQLLNLLFLFKL